MHKLQLLILAVASSGPMACGSVREPSGQEWRETGEVHLSSALASVAIDSGVVQDLPEYRQTAARSRMVTGPNTASVTENGIDKQIGSYGVLGVNVNNGVELAVPNGSSPLRQSAPYGSSLEEHNGATRSYFVGAGLPASEIGAVIGQVGGTSGGSAGQAPTQVGPSVYYSTLRRTANGIPVADSFAWARIDQGGDVVQESVYWPAIPHSVIAQAMAMQAALSGGSAPPAGLPEGSTQVNIRHSSATITGGAAFEAYAVYDVVTSAGQGHVVVRHFQADGTEIRLPQERRTTNAAPTSVKLP